MGLEHKNLNEADSNLIMDVVDAVATDAVDKLISRLIPVLGKAAVRDALGTAIMPLMVSRMTSVPLFELGASKPSADTYADGVKAMRKALLSAASEGIADGLTSGLRHVAKTDSSTAGKLLAAAIIELGGDLDKVKAGSYDKD